MVFVTGVTVLVFQKMLNSTDIRFEIEEFNIVVLDQLHTDLCLEGQSPINRLLFLYFTHQTPVSSLSTSLRSFHTNILFNSYNKCRATLQTVFDSIPTIPHLSSSGSFFLGLNQSQLFKLNSKTNLTSRQVNLLFMGQLVVSYFKTLTVMHLSKPIKAVGGIFSQHSTAEDVSFSNNQFYPHKMVN